MLYIFFIGLYIVLMDFFLSISTFNFGCIESRASWFIFHLIVMNLSLSHDTGREFNMLTWIDSTLFCHFFLIYFFNSSLYTMLVENWVFSFFLWEYLDLITHVVILTSRFRLSFFLLFFNWTSYFVSIYFLQCYLDFIAHIAGFAG